MEGSNRERNCLIVNESVTASLPKEENTMVNMPTYGVDELDNTETPLEYAEDTADAAPTHGTSVTSGWDAAESMLATPKGQYPTQFKPSSKTSLVRFLEDSPFDSFYEHWLERDGKKSFIALGDEDPLTVIAGSKPRPKFTFNVLDLSEETPTVKFLSASKTLAIQLKTANEDERRGPLTKFYWAMSKHGTGPQTTYTLERVKPSDLAEEWELDAEAVEEMIPSLKLYTAADNYRASYEDHLKIAREMVGE